MKRTQLYFDEQLWKALHLHANQESKTISELVREAVRERYFPDLEKRRTAMLQFVGSRKTTPECIDSVAEVQELRKGKRLERLLSR